MSCRRFVAFRLEELLFVLFLLCLLWPSFSSEILLNTNTLAYTSNVLAIILAMLLLVILRSKIVCDVFLALMVTFVVSTLCSTAIAEGDIASCLRAGGKYLLTYLVLSTFYRKTSAKLTFGIVAVVSTFYLVFNFVIMVALIPEYPDGVRVDLTSNMWFLGNKNSLRNIAFLAVGASALWEYTQRGKLRITIVSAITSLLTFWLAGSVTSFVVFLLIVVLYCLLKVKPRRLSVAFVCTFSALFLVVVLVLPVFFDPETGSSLLNRNMTYSGRVDIWRQAWDSVVEHPLLGVGLQEVGEQSLIDANNSLRHFAHAHNAFLDLLYKYGAMGFICAAAVFIESIKCLNHYHDSKQSFILLLFLLADLLCGVFGELVHVSFIVLLALCYLGKQDASSIFFQRYETEIV